MKKEIKGFEKIDKELLFNENLTANEKILLTLCLAFKNAPRGCRLSNNFLMKKTGIRTKAKLTKCLDRLTMFGYLARKQIDNSSNHFVFDKETMQEYIIHNVNKRNKIKRMIAKAKNQPVDKSKIISIKQYLGVLKT